MRTFPYRPIIGTAACLMAATFVLAMGARNSRAAALEPQLDSDDNYSETFTAIADLDGGTYIQIQLNVSNLGVGDANGACRILIVEPGQKAWTASDRIDHDDWKSTGDSLHISGCTMTVSGSSITVEGKLEKSSAKLTINSGIVGKEPPDSKIAADGGKAFALKLLVPWAKAEATFAVAGRAAKTLSGYAYVDHSRGNTLPSQLATRWTRFRALSGDSTLLLARNLPDGGLRGWMWRQKEPFPRPLAKLKLTRVDEKDQAKGYVITGAAGNLDFEINVESQLYRYAPVEEFGVLGVVARSIVGNPVTRTYRAKIAMKDTSNKDAAPLEQSGILEVQHVQ
jgi:hypothetical protein